MCKRCLVMTGHLCQHLKRIALQEWGRHLVPAQRITEKIVPHQLKRRQRGRKALLQLAQQSNGTGEVGQGHQRTHARPRDGAQHQDGARNDAQRAFAAYEEVLEVIAGIVFEHGAQHGQQRPVRQNDLQTQDLLARHAVLHHAVAPRIGGQNPANLTRASRTQVHAEQHACPGRSLLHRLQRGPGLDRNGGRSGIDLLDGIHALH